jgi:NAD(P)-dependent dehydrogenase (short-subunit alcohol dehydrogenase family)
MQDRSKVAIVTGASRGIGAATARRLASDGFAVCVNYNVNVDAAQHVVESIEANGGVAIAIQADISEERQVERLFLNTCEQLGRPYALINNAGILFKQSRVVDLDVDRITKTLATNVVGSFLCAKQAVLSMSTRRGGAGGVIVNISSAAARLGAAGEYVDYAASKGAIDTLTIGLANEVAEEGIRVNGVRPGFIYTQMHADGGEPARVDRLKNSLPIRRGGQPEEVAAAISWLVSGESSYSSGIFIDVSGGR